MRKLYSTKAPRPAPPEFERYFVEHGWARTNQAFGKRATVRWFTMLGAARLRAARDAFVAVTQAAAVGRRAA
jgi:hypothetical protein